MGRLNGRVAIITGGGEGIGLGIARRFAREGATLVIAQRKIEVGECVAQSLREEFGVRAQFLTIDVCIKEQVERLIADTVSRFGAIDILVNNAGGGIAPRDGLK